jgi:hypothetical protein
VKCQADSKEISEKVSQGGRARCPTYEKSMTYIRVGRVHPEGIHPEGLPALQKEFFRDLSKTMHDLQSYT